MVSDVKLEAYLEGIIERLNAIIEQQEKMLELMQEEVEEEEPDEEGEPSIRQKPIKKE